jgi:HlyD family secretion protein
MKKVFISILILAVLTMGYLQLRTFRLKFQFTEGETATVTRGDLTIPINALGEVQPKSRREIKAEASGEVIDVPVEAGDLVRTGDLLVRLKRDDEERNVERAQQDLTRAQANLDRARITLEDRRTSGLQAAKGRLDGLRARLLQADHDWQHIQKLYEADEAPPTEYYRAESTYLDTLAQIDVSEADLKQAHFAVELAEKDVVLAEASVENARTTLADAQERLNKTEIVAPVDGMVAEIYADEGEVIQGGKTTITGGTLLAVLADWSARYVRAEVDEADIGVVLDLAPSSARPGNRGTNENREADTTEDRTAGTEEPVPIKSGAKVKISVEAFPDEEFEGIIDHIYPEPRKSASVVTYLVDIKVISDNRDKLMSAMQADVEFTAQSVYDAVLVPHDAIKRDPNNDLGVYVPGTKKGEQEPEPEFHKCRFGLDNGMFAQVLEGVEEGEVVYTRLPEKTEKEREEEEGR